MDLTLTFFFLRWFRFFQITIAAFSSGLELSMCSEAVYGNDVDFLSWDFGITDGAAIARLLHYFYRASLSPGRPAILGLNMDGRYGSSRVDQLSSLEKMGMSAFWMNPTTVTAMNAAIPDTLGMPEDDIKALPDFVRNFKCSGQIEKGDPYCFKDKYNEFACPKRKGKAHWHPG